MSDLAKLIESEISDFCATLQQPSEPETPAEIQAELMRRIMPLINSVRIENTLLRGDQEPAGFFEFVTLRNPAIKRIAGWNAFENGRYVDPVTQWWFELFTRQSKPVCECTSIDYCESHLKVMGAEPVVVQPDLWELDNPGEGSYYMNHEPTGWRAGMVIATYVKIEVAGGVTVESSK